MKIRIATFTATALFALLTAISAEAQSSNNQNTIEYKKDGGYQSTTSSQTTTPAGATQSSETNVDVSVNPKGYVTEEVQTENVTDPKGLNNKKKKVQKMTTEEKPNGGYEKTVTTNETDAAGANTSTKTKTDVEVNESGDVTATSTTEKTVDPKGLLNKKKVLKKKVKMVNGKVVEEETQVK